MELGNQILKALGMPPMEFIYFERRQKDMPKKKVTVEELWEDLWPVLEDFCHSMQSLVIDVVGVNPKKGWETQKILTLVEKINDKFEEEKGENT